MFNLVGQKFIEAMKTIDPRFKVASGGKEIVTRCIFCGDSKNPTHSHFYISVPQSDTDLSFYQCKRCPNKGIVDDDLLRKLGCSDSNILVEVAKHNTEVMNLPKYKTLKTIDVYPLHWNQYRLDNMSQFKIDYINNRIGSNFNINDLINLKIFLNLADIIDSNNLPLTRDTRVCQALNDNFIGFISYDNSYTSLRKVTDTELYKTLNKRYIIYSLINKSEDRKNYYVIPSSIDIYNLSPVKIHIAEGQFDILSIYYNLNKCNNFQNIYIACNGKSYTQAIEFILEETGVINYEVHLYPDNDMQNYELNNVLNAIGFLPTDIYIHRNQYPNEKDFGVPANRISEFIKVIRDRNVF